MKNCLVGRVLAAATLATLCFCMAPSGAFAFVMPVGSTFIADGLTYKIVTSAVELIPGLVLIPGTVQVGDGSNTMQSVTGDLVIPSTVVAIDGTYDVTAIGANAFVGSSVTSVWIPQGVTLVGATAFRYCAQLVSVTLPEGLIEIGGYGGVGGVFEGCERLSGMVIPDSVASIGNRAFYGCSKLSEVTIPDHVTAIRPETFAFCTGLTSVTIGSGVVEIQGAWSNWGGTSGGVFEGCTSRGHVAMPGGVASIGAAAFKDCTGLTTATIEHGVRTIGGLGSYDPHGCVLRGAFGGCTKLATVTIPDSVTTIGNSAFYNSGLTDLTIPDSVTTIGDSAFLGCQALTGVTIPDSVVSIGNCAFFACYRITDLDVDADNETYSSAQGVLFDKTKSKLIQFPLGKTGSYTIPSSVKTIGDNAFYGSGLSGVTIPDGVNSIGISAFQSSRLASVTVPGSVANISQGAFVQCGNLTDVVIRPGVLTIGTGAFLGSPVTSVVLPQTLERLGSSAFGQSSGFGGWNALKTAQFNSSTTVIEPSSVSWGDPATIPQQATISGCDPSTAKDYAAQWGNSFETLDVPDSQYYVMLLNDSHATTLGETGHVGLFFFTTDQTNTGLDYYFSFGSGPETGSSWLGMPTRYAESNFFDGPTASRTGFVSTLTQTQPEGTEKYDRAVVFRLGSRDLYTRMMCKAREDADPSNGYRLLGNNCLNNADDVLKVANSSYFEGISWKVIPNVACEQVRNDFNARYMQLDDASVMDFNFASLIDQYAVDIGTTVTGIEIATPAHKLVYTVGEPLDVDGLTVKTTFSDGSTQTLPIMPWAVTGFDSSQPWGDQTLVVIASGKMAFYTIRVIAAVPSYTLAYTAGAGGALIGSANQTVTAGDSGTQVIAMPDSAYHFVSWSDGFTTAARQDTDVTGDINVTATFAVNTYTLKYAAGSGGTISSGIASQTVNYDMSGTSVTASATIDGYRFLRWSDESTANPRTDTHVKANVDVTAVFAVEIPIETTTSATAVLIGEITEEGTLTVDPITSGATPPATFFGVADSKFEIAFSGEFTGDWQLTLPYDPDLPDALADSISVQHLVTPPNTWETLTPVSIEKVHHTVTIVTHSLSPFVVSIPAGTLLEAHFTTATASSVSPVVGTSISVDTTLTDQSSGDLMVGRTDVVLQSSRNNSTWTTVTAVAVTSPVPSKYRATFTASEIVRVYYRFAVPSDPPYFTGGSSGSVPVTARSITTVPVYRFRNLINGFYLWSADPTERATINTTLRSTWTEEGEAYSINPAANISTLMRFRNKGGGFYLYSADPNEWADINAKLSASWVQEGPAYNISRSYTAGAKTVWRFRNRGNGTYLYSADPNERADINARLGASWQEEGEAYYLAP